MQRKEVDGAVFGHFREGRLDGWKDHFNPAQAHAFDALEIYIAHAV